jgi:hypothetical protein
VWTKLDDELREHPKVFAAGEAIGRNGAALAIAMYSIALMYTNKYLTDGVIDRGVIKAFRHFDKPITVADALVEGGLFEAVEGGYRIHDYHAYNPVAAAVREHRQHVSTARAKAGLNGARVRWHRHK